MEESKQVSKLVVIYNESIWGCDSVFLAFHNRLLPIQHYFYTTASFLQQHKPHLSSSSTDCEKEERDELPLIYALKKSYLVTEVWVYRSSKGPASFFFPLKRPPFKVIFRATTNQNQ